MATAFPSSCSCADLFENSRGFADPALDQTSRKAIRIAMLNNMLANLNDTGELTTDELLAIGKCCECGIGDLNRDAMFTYILQKLAANIGSSPSDANVQAWATAACNLRCDPRMLDGIELALWCRFFQAVLNL